MLLQPEDCEFYPHIGHGNILGPFVICIFLHVSLWQSLSDMKICILFSLVHTELKVAFALFDQDADGCITTAELRTVMKTLGFDPTDKDVAVMIERFDYDGKDLKDLSRIDLSPIDMMTSSNGNIFRVTGPLCGEFTGHRWIPLTKASDAELCCFLWSAPEYTVE